MRPRIFVYALLLLALILNGAQAVLIGPSTLTVSYSAGSEQQLAFQATNNRDTAIVLSIFTEVGEELANYVALEETSLKLAAGESKPFYVTLKMPEGLEPGPRTFFVGVRETSMPGGGMLTAVAGAKSIVALEVPYPGRYLKVVKLEANNANIGEAIKFKLDVKSLGKDTLSKVHGVVAVTENGVKIGSAETDAIIDLKFLDTGQLNAEWLASRAGEFVAIATIFYDELSTTASTHFKVGEWLVNILDVTYDEISAGTIGKISISVQSKWNAEITGVFNELFIYKEGAQVAGITGKPFSLAPWGTYTDELYWDTKELKPGVYEGKAVAHYGDRTTEQSFKIGLKGMIRLENNAVYVAIILLLVSLLVLLLINARLRK
jgi:hypothetical protein